MCSMFSSNVRCLADASVHYPAQQKSTILFVLTTVRRGFVTGHIFDRKFSVPIDTTKNSCGINFAYELIFIVAVYGFASDGWYVPFPTSLNFCLEVMQRCQKKRRVKGSGSDLELDSDANSDDHDPHTESIAIDESKCESNRLRTAITTVCLHRRSPPASTIVIPSSLPSGDVPNLSFNIFRFSIVLILTQQIFHRLNIVNLSPHSHSISRSFHLSSNSYSVTSSSAGVHAFGYRLFQVQRKRITPAIPMSNYVCYSSTLGPRVEDKPLFAYEQRKGAAEYPFAEEIDTHDLKRKVVVEGKKEKVYDLSGMFMDMQGYMRIDWTSYFFFLPVYATKSCFMVCPWVGALTEHVLYDEVSSWKQTF
ncbi:unnamed protein product [Lactuca virosa]|uniref:Uncharacterized protein n=1 Tax=Lactuca virosa TaxID=75947 RepID=A0AAU9NR28_9ASTR|nr:unnamed protein product [Lactuca virosa]